MESNVFHAKQYPEHTIRQTKEQKKNILLYQTRQRLSYKKDEMGHNEIMLMPGKCA